MHTVLRLIKHNGAGGLEHVIGHFQPLQAVSGFDLAPDGGVLVMKRGQAVHKFDVRVAGRFHHRLIDLIGFHQRDAFSPGLFRLAHRHPDIGVEEIDTVHAFIHMLGEHDARAGFRRDGVALFD